MKIRNAVIGMLLISSFNVVADEIEDQIKLGLEIYQNNDYKGSIDELSYAIAQIREKLNAQQAVLLPDPLTGWTATKIENASGAMSMMGGGTHMSRRYQRGDEKIEITIMAGSPMVAGALAMVNNPMLIGSNPDMKPYRYKRIKGTKQVSGGQIEITLAIAGQIMVQITGNDTDEASIEKYLSAMDFKRIQNSLSQ